MAKIIWDKVQERFYETGVKNCALYLKKDGKYENGVAWNGITAVNETPSGAEANPFYADDMKYFNLVSAEDLGATVEAYYYPDEFAECDGSAEPVKGVRLSQQPRKTFGLCYRTTLGNPDKGNTYGYKLHLLYGCQASPSERAYNTISDSPEPNTMSWDITTTPETVTGYQATALITIDSTTVPAEKMKSLEDILFGTESEEPRLPLPDEVLEMLKAAA